MLARKPLTRSQRGFRMKYPSLKLGRMVACESLLEGDLVILLEFSPGVLSYQEQPARIEYWDGERMREYFPDFEVCLSDGTQAHLEVKSSGRLAKPKIAAKYRYDLLMILILPFQHHVCKIKLAHLQVGARGHH